MAGTQPAERINYRRAIAGQHILAGMTTKQALIAGGFSPWTARTPARAGLNAETCVAEAIKLDPDNSPANITALAARAFRERISGMLETGEHKKTPVLALAKVYQLANLVARPEPGAGLCSPKQFVDTASWLQGLLAEMQGRRSVNPAALPDPQPVVVAVEGESLVP